MLRHGADAAIIIQARMSSARFPEKMMALLARMPLVEYIYRRASLSRIKKVIVATSSEKSDDVLFGYCKNKNIPAVRGELDDVLGRYIAAAKTIEADHIIRLCGDTPFAGIALMENMIAKLLEDKADYVGPDRNSCASGFYSEAVTLSALEKAHALTNTKEDREHVTRFILNSKDLFNVKLIDAGLNPEFVKGTNLTIDEPKDIETARKITDKLADKFNFLPEDILNIIKKGI